MDITHPHDIQRKILERLGYGKSLRFSELRGDTPSNKFAFHLDKLQEKGLIEKNEKGYQLTAHGIEVLPYLEVDNTDRPITGVCLFLHSSGEVYLDKSRGADSLNETSGKISPPLARVERGTSLKEKAEELYGRRFEGESPDLEMAAVLECSTRFDNGAVQDRIIFCFGAEIERDGEEWYAPGKMGGENFLPGIQEFSETLLETGGFIHAAWELEKGSEGLGLGRFEVIR